MSAIRTDQTSVTRYVLVAIGLAAVAALLWRIRDALVIGFAGVVIATVILVGAGVVRRFTRLGEKTSVIVTVLLIILTLGALGWLFGAQTAQQFAELRQQIPEAAQKFRSWVERSESGKAVIESIKNANGDGKAFANFSVAAGAVINGLGMLVLILFAGIYFALDPKLYRNGALRLLPPSRRGQVGAALDGAGGALRQWLVAQLIIMSAVGVLTGVGLGLVGVPLALSLGLLSGLLEFVPLIGPIAAAVPGMLLAFADGPRTALYAALVYVAVQQIESNLLTPLVQRWAVDLPPVIALLSIVAGGVLFGPLGMIFATPLAVVVLELVQHLYVEDTLEERPKRK